MTASGLQERLIQLGATIDATVSEPNVQFSLQVPSSNFAVAAPILRDLLAAPRLDPEAVDTVIAQMHAAIGERNQNPTTALTEVFRRRLYGPSSPFGRLPDYDTLDSLSRSGIEAFHRQFYVPNRTILVIEGDIAAAEVKAKAAEWFGAWKAASGAASTPAAPELPKAPVASAMLFSDRQDLRLAGFVLGHLGGRVSDSDFAAMLVVCELLASGADSRLPTRVKAAGGWRAEWTVAWEAGFDRPGEFTVRGTIDAPFITQSITIVREELAKLREGGITDSELERARVRLLTRLAVRTQSTAEQALDRGLARFHGLPPDLRAQTFQRLATLTASDVARAAAKNLPAEQIVAVVGSSTLFDKPLGTIAPKVEPVELTVSTPRPLAPRTDPASIERGRLLLVKMQEAMGGRERLAAIRDVSIRWEGSTLIEDRMAGIKLWDRWIAGDTLRQDQEFGLNRQAVFYNGKIAWLGTRGNVAALPPAGLALIRSEIFRLMFRLALSDGNPARQVADLGGNVVQITEGDAHGIRIYLDPKTGLPQRSLYRIELGNNSSVSVEELYVEWKEFDGIKWPAKIVSKKNGRRSDDLIVVDAKFNSALQLADLEKKP